MKTYNIDEKKETKGQTLSLRLHSSKSGSTFIKLEDRIHFHQARVRFHLSKIYTLHTPVIFAVLRVSYRMVGKPLQ